jgi:hypothetical protein
MIRFPSERVCPTAFHARKGTNSRLQNLEQQWTKERHTRPTSSEVPRRRRPSLNSSPAEADLFRDQRPARALFLAVFGN